MPCFSIKRYGIYYMQLHIYLKNKISINILQNIKVTPILKEVCKLLLYKVVTTLETNRVERLTQANHIYSNFSILPC